MSKQQKIMFVAIVTSSVIMFVSTFTMSYRLLGTGLLQWVIVVFLAFSTTMLKRFSFVKFSEYNFYVVKESWKERKLVKTAAYALAGPTMIIGLICVVLMTSAAIIFG